MATIGPTTKIFTVANPFYPPYRVFYGSIRGYIQRPRTDKPNEVVKIKCAYIRPDLWNAYCDALNARVTYNLQLPSAELAPGSWGQRESTEALNKCYSKFRDAVYGDSASWGVNLAEYKQTVDMIAKDAGTLRKAWNHLRRGQLGRFKDDLGLSRRKGESPWSKPEMAGSLWLQYHFGWEPLVKDIHDGCKVLEDEFPSRKVRARAKRTGSYRLDTNYGGMNYDVPKFSFAVQMGAEFLVSNPNLHRATSLGLTNPLTIAWEIVPFSFVVDWFWPIGQFLESWSDFFGVTLDDSYTTRSNHAFGSQYMRALKSYGGYITNNRQMMCRSHYLVRSMGILGPAFPYPKAFKGFSVTRGATAIALLVGALSNERRYFAQTARG